MADEDSVQSLMALVRAIPKQVKICLWSGIPCTGGSPAQNLNANRAGRKAKLAAHHARWQSLSDNYLAQGL